jgi:cytochrome c oxidase subunit 3
MTPLKTLMPEEERELREELEQLGRTGGTGLPPVDLPPTGGGDDGDDEEESWEAEHRGPHAQLYIIRIGLFSALAGDLMAFVLLILAFFRMHSSWHWATDQLHQIPDWHPLVVPSILRLATLALFFSALTVEIARRQIFDDMDVMDEWLGLGKPTLKRTLPWLAATLALGGYFGYAQFRGWRELVAHHFSFGIEATPSSNIFYILTGFHLLHLLAGLAALSLGLLLLSHLKRIEIRQIAVDATAWFWMWMCGMWMVIYCLLVYAA